MKILLGNIVCIFFVTHDYIYPGVIKNFRLFYVEDCMISPLTQSPYVQCAFRIISQKVLALILMPSLESPG